MDRSVLFYDNLKNLVRLEQANLTCRIRKSHRRFNRTPAWVVKIINFVPGSIRLLFRRFWSGINIIRSIFIDRDKVLKCMLLGAGAATIHPPRWLEISLNSAWKIRNPKATEDDYDKGLPDFELLDSSPAVTHARGSEYYSFSIRKRKTNWIIPY